MESYSGYNQVPMHPCDEGKTIFISLMANYYYKVMPFRLKYAGATYHRLMNKIFVGYIGTIVEVYIHDMMVKTMEDEKLLTNFETVFGYLCKHIMRLNPQKYAFVIEVRKFLGFMLTHQGIDANPNKCQVILEMKSLISVKDVQHLTRRITSSPGS